MARESGYGGTITTPAGDESAVKAWTAEDNTDPQVFDALDTNWDELIADTTSNRMAVATTTQVIGATTMAVSGLAIPHVKRIVVTTRAKTVTPEWAVGEQYCEPVIGNLSWEMMIYGIADGTTTPNPSDTTIATIVVTADGGTLTGTNGRVSQHRIEYGNGNRMVVTRVTGNGALVATGTLLVSSKSTSTLSLETPSGTNNVNGDAYPVSTTLTLDRGVQQASGVQDVDYVFNGSYSGLGQVEA